MNGERRVLLAGGCWDVHATAVCHCCSSHGAAQPHLAIHAPTPVTNHPQPAVLHALPQHVMRTNPAVKGFQAKVKEWDQKHGDRSVKVCPCPAGWQWDLHASKALQSDLSLAAPDHAHGTPKAPNTSIKKYWPPTQLPHSHPHAPRSPRQGLMEALERGDMPAAPQPTGLTVQLRPYQRQSLQFMLDAERLGQGGFRRFLYLQVRGSGRCGVGLQLPFTGPSCTIQRALLHFAFLLTSSLAGLLTSPPTPGLSTALAPPQLTTPGGLPYWYSPVLQHATFAVPDMPVGGFLAEEMGLGKVGGRGGGIGLDALVGQGLQFK